jgi:Protein of unknown function (DUF3363)
MPPSMRSMTPPTERFVASRRSGRCAWPFRWIQDRHYLIADGIDGRTHWIDIGPVTPRSRRRKVQSSLSRRARVSRASSTAPSPKSLRQIRATIRSIYTSAMILQPRMNLPRRMSGGWKRCGERGRVSSGSTDGTWVIAPDHLERATAYERGYTQTHPVTVEILSHLALPQQLGTERAQPSAASAVIFPVESWRSPARR